MGTGSNFDRRNFLAGVGLSPALLPMLAQEREAAAACLPQGPKRAIFFNWCNGVVSWAKGGETDFTLPDWMSPLEKHRAKLLLLDSVRFRSLMETPNPFNGDSAGHGAVPTVLTGMKYYRNYISNIAGGISVDQHIAQGLRRKGFQGRLSLNLGVSPGGFHSVWQGANQPLPADRDPYHAFETIFGTGSGGMTNDQLRVRRRSILDYLKKDLGRITATVSGEDRLRVQSHLESVRELERSLTAPPLPAGCAPPKLDTAIRLDLKDAANFDTFARIQVDLIVAGLAADVTRVAHLQISSENGEGLKFPWLKGEFDAVGVKATDQYHGYAHAGGPGKVVADRWHMRIVAYLLDRLDAEREGGATMLDNSVVQVADTMNNGGAHQITGVRWFLAGGCGGAFKTGRMFVTKDAPHNRVLCTVANAMGVETKTFGEPEYGEELPGLRV